MRTAVEAGYGVTFISRSAIEAALAAGTLAEARVEGLEPARDIFLARSPGRALTRAAQAFLDLARERLDVIVRWGLDALPEVLGGRRAFLLATERWDAPVDVVGRWSELPTEREIDVGDAEVVLALGGGSTIDTGKRVSAETGLPLVSVPTTYSGSEWTRYFGVRDADRRMRGGGGGAHNEAIVYDVELTLGMPRSVSGGTALNALAHACEALYVRGRDPAADPLALEAARLDLRRPSARARGRLRPCRTRGAAPGRRQGRRGARALRPRARARDGAGDRRPLRVAARRAERDLPAARAAVQRRSSSRAELLGGARGRACARSSRDLAGFTTLSALGVPEEDLPELAATAAGRRGCAGQSAPGVGRTTCWRC